MATVKVHEGLDYAPDRGFAVCAAESGKVLIAGRDAGFGNLIVIRHSNSVVSRYAHLSDMAVKVGDFVEKGTRIGTMGNTGAVTGVKLHFEIVEDERGVDPSERIVDTEFTCE